jgi:hypothetical protein
MEAAAKKSWTESRESKQMLQEKLVQGSLDCGVSPVFETSKALAGNSREHMIGSKNGLAQVMSFLRCFLRTSGALARGSGPEVLAYGAFV